MSKLIGWIKKRVILITLTCSLIALVLSGIAIRLDCQHYEEVTKPHSIHNEIYNRLIRLDDKLERAEENLSEAKGQGIEITEFEIKLIVAKELRDRAEVEWDRSEFDKADMSITEAHEMIEEIELRGLAWWLWLVVMVGSAGMLLLLVYFVSVRGKAKKIN